MSKGKKIEISFSWGSLEDLDDRATTMETRMGILEAAKPKLDKLLKLKEQEAALEAEVAAKVAALNGEEPKAVEPSEPTKTEATPDQGALTGWFSQKPIPGFMLENDMGMFAFQIPTMKGGKDEEGAKDGSLGTQRPAGYPRIGRCKNNGLSVRLYRGGAFKTRKSTFVHAAIVAATAGLTSKLSRKAFKGFDFDAHWSDKTVTLANGAVSPVKFKQVLKAWAYITPTTWDTMREAVMEAAHETRTIMVDGKPFEVSLDDHSFKMVAKAFVQPRDKWVLEESKPVEVKVAPEKADPSERLFKNGVVQVETEDWQDPATQVWYRTETWNLSINVFGWQIIHVGHTMWDGGSEVGTFVPASDLFKVGDSIGQKVVDRNDYRMSMEAADLDICKTYRNRIVNDVTEAPRPNQPLPQDEDDLTESFAVNTES